jgi:hypothetical protein
MFGRNGAVGGGAALDGRLAIKPGGGAGPGRGPDDRDRSAEPTVAPQRVAPPGFDEPGANDLCAHAADRRLQRGPPARGAAVPVAAADARRDRDPAAHPGIPGANARCAAQQRDLDRQRGCRSQASLPTDTIQVLDVDALRDSSCHQRQEERAHLHYGEVGWSRASWSRAASTVGPWW